MLDPNQAKRKYFGANWEKRRVCQSKSGEMAQSIEYSAIFNIPATPLQPASLIFENSTLRTLHWIPKVNQEVNHQPPPPPTTTKRRSIFYLPFSLLFSALFLHRHFRLTDSSCSHEDQNTRPAMEKMMHNMPVLTKICAEEEPLQLRTVTTFFGRAIGEMSLYLC